MPLFEDLFRKKRVRVEVWHEAAGPRVWYDEEHGGFESLLCQPAHVIQMRERPERGCVGKHG